MNLKLAISRLFLLLHKQRDATPLTQPNHPLEWPHLAIKNIFHTTKRLANALAVISLVDYTSGACPSTQALGP
jgi:hypothetical protein